MQQQCRFDYFFLFLSILAVTPVYGQVAQEVSFSGSPNPVGSGARALGMGGAFIGVADDATAASWNPGGLIQLETPEISVVGSCEKRYEERNFAENPGASGSYSTSLTDLNYLSIAYPFTLFSKNMVVSLNYQTLYDFNKEVQTSYQYKQLFPGPSGDRETNKEIRGYLKALSPAYVIQITPIFSAGVTMNWFSSDLGCKWKTEYTDRLVGTFAGFPYSHNIKYDDEYEFDGVNFNLGILWNINSFLTLGAVYKTPFEADVHHKEVYQVSGTTQNAPPSVIVDEDQTMKMPQSYGIGLACRFSDLFTTGLDIYRTDWQNYFLKQADGRKISLFTGDDRSKCNTKPTYQVRLGGEYLFIFDKYVIPLRGGIFYDPEPAAYSPDDFFGVSVGSGIAIGSFVYDMAYQCRWGNDVRKVRLGAEKVSQDVIQHTIYMSIIYHF